MESNIESSSHTTLQDKERIDDLFAEKKEEFTFTFPFPILPSPFSLHLS